MANSAVKEVCGPGVFSMMIIAPQAKLIAETTAHEILVIDDFELLMRRKQDTTNTKAVETIELVLNGRNARLELNQYVINHLYHIISDFASDSNISDVYR